MSKEVCEREEAKQKLKNSLVGIQVIVSLLNQFAVDHQLLKSTVVKGKNVTDILQVSCECDEIIALLDSV
jgi:hypothetical protein